MRIVLTAAAQSDLRAIGGHISRDNPAGAVRFIRELRGAATPLSDMARAFPLVPRYAHLDIRRRPFGDYLIFYRIEDNRLAILHIVHGARDYEALLFPDA